MSLKQRGDFLYTTCIQWLASIKWALAKSRRVIAPRAVMLDPPHEASQPCVGTSHPASERGHPV